MEIAIHKSQKMWLLQESYNIQSYLMTINDYLLLNDNRTIVTYWIIIINLSTWKTSMHKIHVSGQHCHLNIMKAIYVCVCGTIT
jgi:hypothetical protein